MELCRKEKSVKPEYVLYFRFFKVATFCCDDSFAHSWYSLNHLHEVVAWNGFQLTDLLCQEYFVEFLAFLMCSRPSVVVSLYLVEWFLP